MAFALNMIQRLVWMDLLDNPTSFSTYFEMTQPEQGDLENSSPVILVHGLAASLNDWGELIPVLKKHGYTAYALDLLGHGKSSKPAERDAYTIENVYQAFNCWIDSLQIKQPMILIGHSMGGYLSIQYTLRNPDRVKAIILSDPFYSLNQLPRLLRLNYQYSFIDTTFMEHTPGWFVRLMVDLTSLSIRNGYVLTESVRKQTTEDYKRARPEIFNIIKTMDDLTPSLPAITQPTLVLWGSKDATLKPASISKVVDEIPGAIGFEITGAGHVPHQSHPDDFNQKVIDFISNL
jgi:pimeloyl-ACP methyl ester carboxylesterase